MFGAIAPYSDVAALVVAQQPFDPVGLGEEGEPPPSGLREICSFLGISSVVSGLGSEMFSGTSSDCAVISLSSSPVFAPSSINMSLSSG